MPYQSGFGFEFKKMYKPFDLNKKDYITYVNQPPIRQSNPRYSLLGSLHMPNILYYLAFEGSQLPASWAKIMNSPQINTILTPSEYCKAIFKKDVKRPIKVLPHGFNPDIFKPMNIPKNDVFTFGTIGSFHNHRKGLDVLIKAFTKEFGPDENVCLTIKASKVYNPNQFQW